MSANGNILKLRAIKAIIVAVEDEGEEDDDADQAVEIIRMLIAKGPEKWDTVRHPDHRDAK